MNTHRCVMAASVAIGAVVAITPGLSDAGTARVGVATSVPGSEPDVGQVDTSEGAPQGPFCESIPPAGEGSFEGMADDPVATAASNNPFLTTLTSAVMTAGLVDTLNGEGPFTVFAPNNEAFAAVPPADLDAILADLDQLTIILTYHVVIGDSLSLADLIAAGNVVTAQGGVLTFTPEPDGGVSINGEAAMTTCWNIATANATVHVINNVLIPPVDELIDVL